MRSALIAALSLALAGCAVRAGVVLPEDLGGEHTMAVQDYDALLALSSAVDELAARAECGGACEAGDRLCVLSDRVCALASRQPGDAEIASRCVDGRERCERARSRLAEACSCEDADARK